jgi:hypothetical protein
MRPIGIPIGWGHWAASDTDRRPPERVRLRALCAEPHRHASLAAQGTGANRLLVPTRAAPHGHRRSVLTTVPNPKVRPCDGALLPGHRPGALHAPQFIFISTTPIGVEFAVWIPLDLLALRARAMLEHVGKTFDRGWKHG